jgi:hypothetical protein
VQEAEAGKGSRAQRGELKTQRESDQPTGPQRRESRSRGEGADSMTELAKETWTGQGGSDTSRQTSRRGIAHKAASQKKHRCGNLYERLHEARLHECWRDSTTHAAYGVDRVSAEEYAQHLDENIRDRVDRWKRQTYRAKLVRRHSKSVHTRLAQSGPPGHRSAWGVCDSSVPMSCGPI